MSASEIHYRNGNLRDYLWWRFVPGVTVQVKWPSGWVVLHDDGDGGQVSTESADPNDHYRPWLEKNAGKQRIDWDWRIGQVAADNGAGTTGHDTLVIKVRKKKEKWASIAVLRWG